MIHPHVELKKVSDTIGYGVFATQLIPKGTLTYVRDALEISLSAADCGELPANLASIVDKYSYIEPTGKRVVSWDFARFVNHNCNCNTMSTGYGFEIALRDIHAGEEITDEYGLFNPPQDFAIECEDCNNCRGMVRITDIDILYPIWDEQVKSALVLMEKVNQPLLEFMAESDLKAVKKFLAGKMPYRSVLQLKCLESQSEFSHSISITNQ